MPNMPEQQSDNAPERPSEAEVQHLASNGAHEALTQALGHEPAADEAAPSASATKSNSRDFPPPWSKRDPNELTIKQLHFAQHVIAGKSLSDAYKLAYDTAKMNPKTVYQRAYQLRHENGKTRAFIEAAKARITHKITVDKAYVTEALVHSAETALARRTMKIKKVVAGEVVEIEAHFPDRAAANRALELLGKEAGMFIDRREVGSPGDFARLADAELLNLITAELATLNLTASEVPEMPEIEDKAGA